MTNLIVSEFPITPDSNSRGRFAVVPDDADTLPHTAKMLWVGVMGDIKCEDEYGAAVTIPNAFGLLPGIYTKVWATGTDASGIVAWYD